MAVVGELEVKTIVNNKEAEKGLKELKRKLESEEKSLEKSLELKAKIEAEDLAPYKEELKRIQEIKSSWDKENKNEVMKESSYTVLQRDLNEINDQYSVQIEKHNKITAQIEEQRANIERYKDAIVELEDKVRKSEIAEAFKEQAKSVGKSIKSIARMGLAIFGIRSAYYAVRSAINDIGKSNEDVANTIQYAKSMMSTALQPVVEKIVEWLKIMMAYINAIFKAWFKRDLFAETNKNLKKANKQAGALKKTLTGFDEMNILNSSSSGGGGGIPDLPDVDDNSIFKWILNNKDEMLKIIASITAGLIAMKVLGFAPLQAVLLAIMGYGVMTFLQGIVDMFNNPTWLAFGQTIEGLGIAFVGLGLALETFTATSGPVGWVIAGIGALLTLFGSYIQELEETAASVHNVQQAEEDLHNARADRQNAEKQYADAIKRREQAEKDLQKAEKETKLSGEKVYEMVKNNEKAYEDLTPPQRKVYDAYLNEQIALTDVNNALQNINDSKEKELYNDLKIQIANDETGESYEALKKKIVDSVNEEKLSVEHAQDLITRMISDMGLSAENVFLSDIPNSIKKGLDTSQYDNALKRFGRNLREKIIEGFGQLTLGGTFSLIKLVGSVIKGAKGLMYYPKLPKLAVGGIVNQPGRGIPYRGATIGERGAEAVVPLTDSQQMELLGATIGRYITINNTNPIYMNGRLIAKEINRSNAEDDFAFNR